MTKPFLSGMLRLAISVALTSLCACGAGEGAVGGGGPGSSGDATEGGSWLTGDWKGNYKAKAKETDDATALRETSAEATFKETETRTGEFTIKLPALDKVAVSGIYHDFQGKSLLLDIKESNLSTIGSPNSSTDMDYDLVGDALELHNERITIRLVRGTGPSDGGGKDGEDPNKDMVVDDWLCRDANEFSWKIEISEAAFSLDVFDPTGARESVWMKGDVKITRGQTDADAVLTVTSSGQKDKYKGLELRGNTLGTNMMNLRRMVTAADGSKSIGETMQCNTI